MCVPGCREAVQHVAALEVAGHDAITVKQDDGWPAAALEMVEADPVDVDAGPAVVLGLLGWVVVVISVWAGNESSVCSSSPPVKITKATMRVGSMKVIRPGPRRRAGSRRPRR